MENNIEFFKILKETLQNSEEQEESNEKICLITKTPLVEKFVKLKCGHSFNYNSLYNEFYSQKFGTRTFHSHSNILKCPYCRYQIKTLLPYYPELNLEPIYGINTDELKYRKINYNGKCVYANYVEYFQGNCSYIYPKLDSNGPHVFCKNTYVVLHSETNKSYCAAHIYFAKKQYMKEKTKAALEKIRLEKKQKKLEEKEKKKCLDNQEKEKKKQEKEQQKLENKLNKKSNKVENEIISLNPVIPLELDHNFCIRILKYGKNVGKQCGCKIFKDNICKKHCPKEENN